MGFLIRLMLILGLIGYIAEGKYKDVPDPPKVKTNDAFIKKIHKEGLIGYTNYNKNKNRQESKPDEADNNK